MDLADSWNFFLIFWFFFAIAWKCYIFIFFKVRLKICRGIRGGRRPTTTPGKFSSELLKNENITFSSDCENKIKIFRQKFQLLSQIHNIQPKITSLYIWYTRLCHHLCNKLPCYIVIWKSRSRCVFQYSSKKSIFFSKYQPKSEIFKFRNFRKIG